MLTPHAHGRHAFAHWRPIDREGLTVVSRRNMLKAGLAGVAGLSLPALLKAHDAASMAGQPASRKSVILLWMTGGPSHIDTWDMKPTRPVSNRGPFAPIDTALPGVAICEHLPKQAAMLDRFTLIRSVDCRQSSHEPNQVMQSGNREAEPRINPKGDKYPAIGSIIAQHRAAQDPGVPPYVVFQRNHSHVAWGGWLGKEYDPFDANQAVRLPALDLVGKPLGSTTGGNLLQPPVGLHHDRLSDRRLLTEDFDRLRRGLDQTGSMDALDRFGQQAFEMMVGRRTQAALDLAAKTRPHAPDTESICGASRRSWRDASSRPERAS